MAIRFDISSSTCPAGGHFDVTVSKGAASRIRTYHVNELRTPPTSDEIDICMDVLLRLLVSKLNSGSHAECRDRIHGLEIAIQPRSAS